VLKIEKQTVEEMVSVEQNLQVQLKNVLVSMEAKRTDFDHIRQDVNKVKNTSRMGRNSWQWR
jgi:secreted Zn-dependent insulinase-like peptidase